MEIWPAIGCRAVKVGSFCRPARGSHAQFLPRATAPSDSPIDTPRRLALARRSQHHQRATDDTRRKKKGRAPVGTRPVPITEGGDD